MSGIRRVDRRIIMILVAAVVAAGILVAVLVGINAASRPADPFWACMSDRGYDQNKPLSESGHTMDEFRADGDACAELTGTSGLPTP